MIDLGNLQRQTCLCRPCSKTDRKSKYWPDVFFSSPQRNKNTVGALITIDLASLLFLFFKLTKKYPTTFGRGSKLN